MTSVSQSNLLLRDQQSKSSSRWTLWNLSETMELIIISPNLRLQQNQVEMVIQEIKKQRFWQMVKHKVPKWLWDYGHVRLCQSPTHHSLLTAEHQWSKWQVKLLTYLNTLTLDSMIGFGTRIMLDLVRTVLDSGLASHIELATSCHIGYLWKWVMWLLIPQSNVSPTLIVNSRSSAAVPTIWSVCHRSFEWR